MANQGVDYTYVLSFHASTMHRLAANRFCAKEVSACSCELHCFGEVVVRLNVRIPVTLEAVLKSHIPSPPLTQTD